MIHHVVYCQLRPDTDAATLEELVRSSRSMLLRVPEVLSVRSGRNLDPSSEWQFFFSFEVDSREKLRMTLDDAFHIKFIERYIHPHTTHQLVFDFELDPSKSLKYS